MHFTKIKNFTGVPEVYLMWILKIESKQLGGLGLSTTKN